MGISPIQADTVYSYPVASGSSYNPPTGQGIFDSTGLSTSEFAGPQLYTSDMFESEIPEWLLFNDFDYLDYASSMHSHPGSPAPSRKVSDAGKKLLQNKEFMNKVISIAGRIGCDFKDLLGVMRAESGLNPAAVNKSSGASGLIQFMPKTARGLGTSVEAIRNMSAVQQLDYVEQYLIRAKRSAGFKDGQRLSAGQLYALVFLPARANREVLTTSNEAYYRCNSATDANGDGQITRSEMDARAKRYRVDEYIPHEYMA